MRNIIFLKLMSVFGGALSVWMELHFFYTFFDILSKISEGRHASTVDTILMSMDVWLIILGIFLHYYVENNQDTLLKRGSAQYEPKAVMER